MIDTATAIEGEWEKVLVFCSNILGSGYPASYIEIQPIKRILGYIIPEAERLAEMRKT